MPRLAANISPMFAEVPFVERFAAAARAAFRCVEYQFPYAFGGAAELAARAREFREGCEYVPRGDTVAGLAWAKPWL